MQILYDAASDLPVCDRSAKLHAILRRVTAAHTSSERSAALAALLDATEQALADDPWLRFYRAVRAVTERPDAPETAA